MNLFNEPSHSRFLIRKWNTVKDQSNTNYDVGNEIIYNTEVLRPNFCDCNNDYILVRGDITIIGYNGRAFKNCEPFTKCITKIGGTTIDDAEDFWLVMPMYSLLEYSSNYSDAAGSL